MAISCSTLWSWSLRGHSDAPPNTPSMHWNSRWKHTNTNNLVCHVEASTICSWIWMFVLCAAPASSSRWSHFTEIQWWASHPEERAVQRPRWTRKPGELTWKEQRLYHDWIKDLWEDLPVFRYSRGRCKHTYTWCASDEHSFSIALFWSCQTVRKKDQNWCNRSRVGLPLFSSFKLTCMLLNYLFTCNNYLETVKTVLLK